MDPSKIVGQNSWNIRSVNRKPRNGEFAGSHNDEATNMAFVKATVNNTNTGTGKRHYVRPDGLIVRVGSIVRS